MAGTFKIGLTMAGAISGGAYTAGVLDFLFEALAEWEKAKKDPALQKSWLDQKTKEQEEDHAKAVKAAIEQGLPAPAAPPPIVFPDHNVVVPVIVGASAGTICANLLPVALGLRHAPKTYKNMLALKGKEVSAFLPTLYEAWVEKPNFVRDYVPAQNEMDIGDFLRNDDIEAAKTEKVASALNTSVLDNIGIEALAQAPAAAIDKCANVPDTLHVYATLGNLRGVPYKIDFSGGNGTSVAHGMRLHSDRAHIVFKNVGNSTAYAGPYAQKDPSDLTIDIANLPIKLTPDQIFGFDSRIYENNWGKFLAITLGSSAFPGALRTRRIAPSIASYSGRSWPVDTTEMHNGKVRLMPAWDTEADPNLNVLLGTLAEQSTYEYRSVDGGTFDNEPFQITRYSLFEDPINDRNNKWKKGEADRAVLMIDPFPEPPSVDPRAWKPEDDLLKALLGIPGAFKNHARFKLEDLIKAQDESYFSRFLIAPLRLANGASNPERLGLACGLLGGFGGFLDIQLRQHDFLLGRRNCQAFLKKHFMLKQSGKVLDGKGAPDKDGDAPIIPLFGSAAIDVDLPPWPKVTVATVRRFAECAGIRGEAVFDRLTKELPAGMGWGARQAGWIFGLKTKITRAVFQIVLADLLRRNCLDCSIDPTLGTIARKAATEPANAHDLILLAAFCDKAEGKRDAEEIAKDAGLINDRSELAMSALVQKKISDTAELYPDFISISGGSKNKKYQPRLLYAQ